MADDRFDAVADAVRERVVPDAAERERLESVVGTLMARAEAAIAERDVDAEALHLGSTARDTWIAGDRDVDVFVRFPPDLPRADLERLGLEIGHDVLPDGHEEYAEHPYVRGTLEGFDVDLVPCYDVESAADIRSAVDRTPFHAAYLEGRLSDELTGEVRVFKQLLKGVGVYGSDLRTRGFSGYLTELLVLEFGSARETLAAVADWQPPVRLDPGGHGEDGFDDPLVVVDPTDPGRNVAAVLSAGNLARLQHHARAVLEAPTVEAFFPDPPAPLDDEGVRGHLERRATTPVAVAFEAPDLVEDDLYPQLRRSLAGVGDELERRGFDVLRRATFATEEAPRRAVLLFELAVAERPVIERHAGPPVGVREHAERFYERYADDPDVYGPFVDGDRYVVEREREYRTAAALLESDAILEVGLGSHVRSAIEAGADVLVDEEVAGLAEAFGTALAAYFDPRP